MDVFDEARNTDTESRSRLPEVGPAQRATITGIRYKETESKQPGVVVTYTIDGSERGNFIGLTKNPMFKINYGLRDLKVLIGAVKGWRAEDPRTKEIDGPAIKGVLGPDQPLAGREVMIEATDEVTKAGKNFRKVSFFPVTTAADGVARTAPSVRSPVAPPPVLSEDWYDFPAGDPRAGKQQYNRTGMTRTL